MAATVSNNTKYLISVGAVALVAVAAYGLGRVYPPLGPTAGTITPADRYISSQVGEGDVTLGDTSVPELMQTDAFELMVKDPSFRALAASEGFKSLAGQPQVMAALMSNPKAFSSLAADPRAFSGVAQAAKALSGISSAERASNGQVLSAVYGHSAAM